MTLRKSSVALAAAVMAVIFVRPAGAIPIVPTDLLVFQGGDATTAAAGTSTPLYIDDINPALAAQTSPVQSFPISTQTAPLFTSNEGSDGDLALSNNGKLVTFSGWTSSNGSAAENLVPGRGAGALDALGDYTQPATYTGSSTAGYQTRSAYSPDGVNYYFGDKGGVYVQGSTGPVSGIGNTRPIKGFGGQTYALQAQSGQPLLSIVSPTTPSSGTMSVTATALPGAAGVTDANAVDFTLLSSGTTPGVYDTLYYTDNTGIIKDSYNGTTWVTDGSDTSLGTKLSGITAVSNGLGGTNIYVTSDPSSGAAVLEEVTDSAAYNATGVFSAATTLYTAPSGDVLRGVSLAPSPVPEPASAGVLGLVAMALLGRRRRSN